MNGNLMLALEMFARGVLVGLVFALASAVILREQTLSFFRKNGIGYVLMLGSMVLLVVGFTRSHLLSLAGLFLVWGVLIALSDRWTEKVLSYEAIGITLAIAGLWVTIVKSVIPLWPAVQAAYDSAIGLVSFETVWWSFVGAVLLFAGSQFMRGRRKAIRNRYTEGV